MEEVEELCTRIAIIDHGKIIAEGTKAQLKSIITDQKDIGIEVQTAAYLEANKLKEISGVKSVEVKENVVHISSDAGVNNLNKIIQQFMAQGIEIRSVQASGRIWKRCS